MNRRRKAGSALVAAGLVMLLGAVILTLYNLNRGWDAVNAGYEIMSRMDEAAQGSPDEYIAAKDAGEFPDDMDSVNVDGYEYIGYLTVPSLDIELPVTKTWSYDKLKIAACRYSGSVAGGDLVICGHNYSGQFAKFTELNAGAIVTFRDIHGGVTAYSVSDIELVSPDEVDRVKNSGAALALFTCNYSGRARYVILCDAR